MKRGTITILIILLVAVVAAVTSVWFHFRNQQHAQQFWGSQTALLIDQGPTVEVVELGEAKPGLSLGGDDEPEEPANETSASDDEPAVRAIEFGGKPWIITRSKEAASAKGISNLRRALVLDTTYDWEELPEGTDPNWQYGLAIEDGQNWATVLFDFDTRQIALAGDRRTAVLNPEANSAFQEFFSEQFEAGEPGEDKPDEKVPADEPAEAPTSKTPADSTE